MLVFDEPTASLDPIAESRIIDKILSIKEKLIIIISHRMACAMQMDDIIVFSEGKIVEKGNHEDLMNRKGMYFSMFTEQSKKYEVI